MCEDFNLARKAWGDMEGFRSDRNRCKRYVYGEQWDDVVVTPQGRFTERELLRNQGQEPLKNNVLRRILRNVVGLYRAQYRVPQLSGKDSGLRGSELKEANRRRREWFAANRMEELAPRLVEEFLISGLVAVKVAEGRIAAVTPDNFFFHSDGYDPLGRDVDLVGEVHRVSYGSLLERFCRNADDYRRIREVYRSGGRSGAECRLTEVWSKEVRVFGLLHDEERGRLRVVEMEDDAAVRMAALHDAAVRMAALHDTAVRMTALHKVGWRCRWYADDGTLLREEELRERHPYVFKPYPFIDGEMHSYISDVIDQQRYVNRLITLYDFIMRSSAKGVLLFPEESLPAGMDLRAVAEEWSCFNGVLPYRAKPGVPMPTQVSANSTNIGITDLLKIEMQMLEDISGVSPTLQGKLQTNSTSGTLFAQQNEAAQTSLQDILRSFGDFLRELAELSVKS